MSMIQVTDRRGGVYEVVVTFSYGECARLPFNSLRKVNARIDQIRNGGLKATAQFNLRNSIEAAHFVEMLDMFGEDGSFVHGSPADPEELKKDVPEDDEDESGIRPATVIRTQPEEHAVPSPSTNEEPVQGSQSSSASQPEPEQITTDEQPAEEAEDLEIDESFGVVADENWQEKAEEAIAISLAEHENKAETMNRLRKVSGERYSEDMAREKMIALLWEKFQDEAYVAAFLKRRDWNNVSEDEVRRIAG